MTPTEKMYVDLAMKAQTQSEANYYFGELVKTVRGIKPQLDLNEAEDIVKQNLGYYAGYFDDETRERVERLYNCAHPVFGKIAETGPISPEEALRKGMELGAQARLRKALEDDDGEG
jgi:hypothetical protein